MVRNKKIPFSGGDKSQVLCTLQVNNAIHFEKTLTATTASTRDRKTSGLTVPSWFVQKHGDKLRQSAVLRMVGNSSTKAWPVNLTVCINTPACTQVKFWGGWKAFATSNGLWEGDSLFFALTAMSEFEVYVFRSIGGQSCHSPALRRKWTLDSDISRKKAKRSDERRASEQAAADRADDGDEEGSDEVTTNGVIVAERKTVQETVANVEVAASAFGHSPPSCRKDLHLLPGFSKKLTVTNVSRWDKQGCLEFPGSFWKQYGSQIGSVVKLQGIREESPVRTMACCFANASTIHSRSQPKRHYLRAAWRAFVHENRLRVGQELYFALTADSFFVVREVHIRKPRFLHPERSDLIQDHNSSSSNTKGDSASDRFIVDSEG